MKLIFYTLLILFSMSSCSVVRKSNSDTFIRIATLPYYQMGKQYTENSIFLLTNDFKYEISTSRTEVIDSIFKHKKYLKPLSKKDLKIIKNPSYWKSKQKNMQYVETVWLSIEINANHSRETIGFLRNDCIISNGTYYYINSQLVKQIFAVIPKKILLSIDKDTEYYKMLP